ncbi:MAG: hypothetical protein IT546_13825 [Caulobacteraceae bacterium]|nr:hypothetical protein [Caulobacteraceae bacterium]
MFAAFPLLVLPVLIYNVIALALPGAFGGDATARMAEVVFDIPMASSASWQVTIGDLLLAASLIVLFVELLKSTTSRKLAIINHGLSLLLFIVCLVELLLAPAFATSTFFLITLMVLLDVLAGFIVTIVSARRDIDFAQDM